MTNARDEMLPWHERQSGHQESRDNDYRTLTNGTEHESSTAQRFVAYNPKHKFSPFDKTTTAEHA